MNGKTKQEQLLKAIRKEKRFVRKMSKKKEYNERIFAIKKLYESGMTFYNRLQYTLSIKLINQLITTYINV